MLSNKGSTRLGFLLFFLFVIFLIIIILFFALKGKNIFNVNKKDYSSYAENLKSATTKYVNKYYSDLKSGETLIVKSSTLKEYKYLETSECIGYSFVTKDSKIEIETFIKCPNYISNNYDSSYE